MPCSSPPEIGINSELRPKEGDKCRTNNEFYSGDDWKMWFSMFRHTGLIPNYWVKQTFQLSHWHIWTTRGLPKRTELTPLMLLRGNSELDWDIGPREKSPKGAELNLLSVRGGAEGQAAAQVDTLMKRRGTRKKEDSTHHPSSNGSLSLGFPTQAEFSHLKLLAGLLWVTD